MKIFKKYKCLQPLTRDTFKKIKIAIIEKRLKIIKLSFISFRFLQKSQLYCLNLSIEINLKKNLLERK